MSKTPLRLLKVSSESVARREADLYSRVVDRGLLKAGHPVVVMLSGGRDSVCLLDLAVRVIGASMVEALHINYGVRSGAGSDERYCDQLCRSLGVKLHVLHPDSGSSNRGNFQAWARSVRYRAAKELAEAKSASIAVGHTADDQVETVLYRLATSPGRKGLLGMEECRGSVVRPLLRFWRSEITSYCQARGLSWRDDPTNAGASFARGRIRNRVIPEFERLHPAFKANLLRTMTDLKEEAAVIDGLIDAELGGSTTISLQRLESMSPVLRPLAVRKIAQLATGIDRSVSQSVIGRLIAMKDSGGTRFLDLGGKLRAIVEYGQLRVEHCGLQSSGLGKDEEVMLTVPGSVPFGSYVVKAELVTPAPCPGTVDAGKLSDKVVVRTARPGDRITPLGMEGRTKKLQDIFTDRHIPRSVRSKLPIVSWGEEIVCVPDVALSESFKVTDETESAVRFTVEAVR